MDAKNSLTEQYELIKEIHYVFNLVEPKIKGRIYKIIIGANAKYTWDINYYCRLEDEIEAYTPSAPFADSLETIEQMLFQYAKRFEKAVDWRLNNYF